MNTLHSKLVPKPHISFAILTLTTILRAQPTSRPAIDMRDYFLQSDDNQNAWTLGGTDVRESPDPDSPSSRAIILNKYSSPDCYEVYHITPTDIRLRYEVFRPGTHHNADNWIRRYQSTDPSGDQGSIWCPRFVTPGQPGILTHFHQDLLTFNPQTHSYSIDPTGSVNDQQIYLSIVPSSLDWGKNNQSSFDLTDSVRLISQWQHEGKIIETYDYARGKGLIAWRWLERFSTLTPLPDHPNIFYCEEGFVRITSPGDQSTPPTVLRYNPATKQSGPPFQVVPFTSYWQPALGNQWYIVYRDTSREFPLRRRAEQIKHNFTLPEWTAKPGATIKDLPYLFVTPLAVQTGHPATTRQSFSHQPNQRNDS
ncbi:MAG TPA: hypothetical protein VFE58_17030 [Tepidisphaeraceae bacterium]|jgi:hypothetical protein|nr:hypothetical protein [Tepidisphaeraceae bacterium]